MKIIDITTRTITKIKRDGFRRTYNAVFSNIYDNYFDWKYGLDTEAWVSHEDLVNENKLAEHTGHYQAINVILIKNILNRLNLSKEQTFVDYGSGKGRVLLLAAEYGFKKVKGIELSKKLCDIALKNIDIYKSKRNISQNIDVLNIDATTYQLKKEDTILHFFNPFNGIIFEKVVNNIKKSLEEHPRKMTIIYMNPLEKATLESKLEFSSKESFFWNEEYIIYTIN
ncbi:rRNA adenine N-6-methyltransferase family protein [Winogradskyella ursingii]|uniref:rRNA adenine N-6-methyltransferase family protein n=1 Tax=Winogradskyella ursingii TaxID=2686079 RepID=UPI0015C7DE76|nr:rRNA adenine N-6-methyltransferase family protein [Winogradskyella ursingii]